MRLSTAAGRYGVRAMYDLALHYGKGPVAGKAIAERQNISLPYLEQLLTKLRRSGLVQTVRGPQGGYLLARVPSRIKVGEIIGSLEGPTRLAHCMGGTEDSVDCGKADGCVSRILLKKLDAQIKAALNSTTLNDLCREAGLDACPTRRPRKRVSRNRKRALRKKSK
ncbi:MAG: Rrf2 family transcriptional regulator [Candidatus Eiseniibacteriota bacterium]|nr:MAG: Rrf2 family transcriptional regulator [Candidatus Eisenbacteria bacterium]